MSRDKDKILCWSLIYNRWRLIAFLYQSLHIRDFSSGKPYRTSTRHDESVPLAYQQGSSLDRSGYLTAWTGWMANSTRFILLDVKKLPYSLGDVIESIKIHFENTRTISVHRMRLPLHAVLPKASWTRAGNTQLGTTAKIVVIVEFVNMMVMCCCGFASRNCMYVQIKKCRI